MLKRKKWRRLNPEPHWSIRALDCASKYTSIIFYGGLGIAFVVLGF